tara:strand:- start:1616 stop:1873 length:258 start_codon:yes stop_codon:yes gene_type:complete
MGLLKFILYAIIIYYCILFFSRFLFRFLLKRWAYKFHKKMKQKSSSDYYKERKEGETVVQYKKQNRSKSDPGGEYIDFEDLNDTV